MRLTPFAAAIAFAALLVWLPASAAADTITVHPSGSIQDAIDHAHPGDKVKLTSGTYEQCVVIKKDDIEVRGSGAKTTKLVPPATPAPDCMDNGISVTDSDQNGNVIHTVNDVHISGLTVHGFASIGIVFFGTSDIEVDHVVATNNTDYGITAFNSSKIDFSDNTTLDNGEAGIYVGDSPQAKAEVEDNEANGNDFGILVRDASFGKIKNNETSGNCGGILFVNTGPGVGNWKAKRNEATANTKACPPDQERPAFSGFGIAVLGGHDIWIIKNKVLDNEPSGPSVISGGIAVSGFGPPPGTPSVDIHVVKNVSLGNKPVDLLWDGAGTGNEFVRNVCKTSDPAGLCKKGNGEHGNANHGDDDNDNGQHHGKNHEKGKNHKKGKNHDKDTAHEKRHRGKDDDDHGNGNDDNHRRRTGDDHQEGGRTVQHHDQNDD
jgi:parallel beta-helix repeat protein